MTRIIGMSVLLPTALQADRARSVSIYRLHPQRRTPGRRWFRNKARKDRTNPRTSRRATRSRNNYVAADLSLGLPHHLRCETHRPRRLRCKFAADLWGREELYANTCRPLPAAILVRYRSLVDRPVRATICRHLSIRISRHLRLRRKRDLDRAATVPNATPA